MKNAKESLGMLPQVQRFAFGGIANPTQRATLRASDREYLGARAADIEEFERQRQAYNDALTQYTRDVYDPYQAQFDAYQRAVDAYNAGPREGEYAGPAAPTLPSQFDMTAPVLPFDEAKVVERQKAAAQTARRDAANRATAINVVSNPDQFGFGSLSIADRFMAEGGSVEKQRPREDYRKPPSVKPGDAFYESPEYKAFEKKSRINDPWVPRDMMIHESPYFGFFGSSGLGRGMDRTYESYLERVAREAKEAAPAPRPIPVTPPSMPVIGQPITRDPVAPPGRVGAPGAPVTALPGPGRAPVLGSNVDISRFISSNIGGAPVSGVGGAPVSGVGAPAPRSPAGSAPMLGGQPTGGAPRSPAISTPMMPDYSLRGVGTAQQNLSMPMFGGQPTGGASTNPQNYFAMMGPAPAGQLPGTVASAPLGMPLAAGQRTLDTINANPNLTPRMLGGIENAGIRYDRLGNAVYAPGMGPLMFAEGGEVRADEDEAGVGEVGSAQALLAQLEAQAPRRAKKATPALKRVSARSDGASMPKGMGMEQESLGSVRELVAMAKDKGSARQQMEELARLYKLKIDAAQDRSRGLAASTFGAPTLEGTTLTKNTLATKRFAEGGEVMDPEAALFAGRDDVPAKPNMTGRELAQQALYGAGDLPYVMAGAPVDLAAMVMAPFGYKDDKPFMGSADIKARMTRAGIRPADTKEDRLKGPRVAAELLASLINPAAATRGAAMAVERGARGAGDAARKLEDATVGSVQRARIRSAADKVPPDTAYDPLRKRMEASGNLALAVRPDKIKDLMEVVRDQKGNYGARRVERAADEIPNLEELFEKDALREVFTGDNARALITLRPADFEQYALELTKNRKSDVEPSFSGVPDKYTTTTDQYVDYLSRLQGGFKEVPYLNLYKDEVGLPVKPEVKGHEGRHRNRALAERGERTSLVQISPRGDLREGLPRRTQEEYIEALKEELERSGRLVLPERQGPSFPFRPAIKLPDVYAKGGPVDKNTAFIKAHS
jgi:hypothetical protein